MVKLTGVLRLGADAELVENPSWSNALIKFNAVHSGSYKDSSGNKLDTSLWVQCDYWVKSKAILPYLLKGAIVYIEGEPKSSGWVSKSTGAVQTSLGCNVKSLEIVSFVKKDELAYLAEDAKEEQKPKGFVLADEDDMPF